MIGVILYGPPAAGKDTVDAALGRLDPRFEHFRRLKCGPGRQESYEITTERSLEALRETGQIIWENQAYHATYAIDRQSLIAALKKTIPIVHLGQVGAIDAVEEATPARWLVVELWCPRLMAAERLRDRSDADIEARLRTWDATPRLGQRADLTIDTSTSSPAESAQQIADHVRA